MIRLPATSLLFLAAALPAQWPSTPGTNLSVGDGVGEQVLNKVAVTSDGGCYVGWFDSGSGSYTVRLQRLDPQGNEMWPHNGLLVSNQPQSTSLVDWDLICDSEDCCVLAFTDTRAGSDLDVYAYRVAGNGTMLWGQNGVTLSNNADYEANPRVCEASDGDFVFVWPETVTRAIQLQRLDRAGTPRYPGDGIAIPGDTGATPAFARIVAADAGAVIVSWVRTMAFSGQKHIHTQKFDPAGTALWNGGLRLPVFDSSSVPIAHEPRLLSDGAGGAVYAWHYAPTTQFFARVQRVLANGTEAFAHNGVDLCTNGNSKFDPAVVFVPATQSIVAFWNERNVAQSTWGISAQRIDLLGAQAWGPTGVTLLPINTTVKFAPVAVPYGDGAMGFVLEESLGGLNDKVLGLRVDGAGSMVWGTPVDVCTFPSDKLRLVAAVSVSGCSMLSWTDLRANSGETVMQDINADGSLGDRTGSATSYGCGFNPAGSLTASRRPAFGTGCVLRLDNPLATQAPGSLGMLAMALRAPGNYPCGTTLPGLSMQGPAALGEVLLDLTGQSISLFGGVWAGTGQPVQFPLLIPAQPALYGLVLYAQGALLDPTPAANVPVGLSEGVRLALGY